MYKNSQTNPDIVKTIGCSLQSQNKALLLTITATQLIEHGEVELVPM